MESSEASPIGQADKKKKQDWFVVATILLGLIGSILYVYFDKELFPSASIDMKLNEQAAEKRSRSMAKEFGYDPTGAIVSTTFAHDEQAKNVLEFNVGIGKANEMIRSEVPVWKWRTRMCKEGKEEEFYCNWTTQGALVSVANQIPNDAKLPDVSHQEAQKLAEKFASGQGYPLKDYELFDDGTEKKLNRTDHYFVWRKTGYPQSEMRCRVDIQGNQIGSFKRWLNPSDTWSRKYKSIRQWNDVLGAVASFGLFIFIALTIYSFIKSLTEHNIRWSFVMLAAGLAAALVVLDNANNGSELVSNYDPSTTAGAYALRCLLNAVFIGIFSLVSGVLILGGAEPIYRATRLSRTKLESVFTWTGMARTDFKNSVVLGYAIAGVMMLWETVYYTVGRNLGYFCPMGVDDYRVLGNWCPAIGAALIGVSASGLEELLCRVVALGLFEKWTKNFWVANCIQAVIWGFAHSSYPQQPCYARGIELTVVGLFFGFVVKRYGVVPCLIAHYLYDAFLTVEPVFASHDARLIAPSVVVLIPFVVLLWYSRVRAKASSTEADEINLSNATTVPPERPQLPDLHSSKPPVVYTGHSRKVRILLSLAALLIAAVPFFHFQALGKDKKLTISPDQALNLAKKYLKEDAVSPDGYMSTTECLLKPEGSTDQTTWQYLFEKLGFAATSKIYDKVEPCIEYRVRFFKELDPRSWSVFLNADGSKRVTLISDNDDSPGAKLSKDEALKLITDYISKYRPELTPFTVASSTKTDFAQRRDYSFNLAVASLGEKDAPAEINTEIKGDKISNLIVKWELPDKWKWEHQKDRPYFPLFMVGKIACGIVLIIALLWYTIHALRTTRVPWRFAIIFGAVMAAMTIASNANMLPKELGDYDNADSLNSFIGKTLANKGTMLILQIGGTMILSLVSFTSMSHSFPELFRQLRSLPILLGRDKSRQKTSRNLWLDAAICSYGFISTAAVIHLLQQTIQNLTPVVPMEQPGIVEEFSAALPSLQFLLNWGLTSCYQLLMIIILAGLFKSSKRWIALTFCFVFAVSMVSPSWYWQATATSLGNSIIFMALFLGYVFFLFRSNVLTYIAAFTVSRAVQIVAPLLASTKGVATPMIYFFAFIAAIPLLGTIYILFKTNRSQPDVVDTAAGTSDSASAAETQ